jgi:hypothetical protein
LELGFGLRGNVESIAMDQLIQDFSGELPASFWTVDRLEELRAADAEIDSGNVFSAEQLMVHAP